MKEVQSIAQCLICISMRSQNKENGIVSHEDGGNGKYLSPSTIQLKAQGGVRNGTSATFCL